MENPLWRPLMGKAERRRLSVEDQCDMNKCDVCEPLNISPV